jgi:hypothetical protein
MTVAIPLVGQEIYLAEADYRYGVGPLRMRVTEVLNTVMERDGQWINVRGTIIRSGGSCGPDRFAYLRVSALRKPNTVRRRPGGASGAR